MGCTCISYFEYQKNVTTFWNKVWIQNLIPEKIQMPSFMNKDHWNELTALLFDWYSQDN